MELTAPIEIKSSTPVFLLRWTDGRLFIGTEAHIRSEYNQTVLFHRAALKETEFEWVDMKDSALMSNFGLPLPVCYDLDEVFVQLNDDASDRYPDDVRQHLREALLSKFFRRRDVIIQRLT